MYVHRVPFLRRLISHEIAGLNLLLVFVPISVRLTLVLILFPFVKARCAVDLGRQDAKTTSSQIYP
jgi:hypothetical protein